MMPTSATGATDPLPGDCPHSRGFTLLELLVVLVIMGLALTGVTLALHSAPAHRLGNEARRLSAVLEAAQDQAELTGQELLVQLDRNGWQFFHWTPDAGWQALGGQELPAGKFDPMLDSLDAAGPSNSPGFASDPERGSVQWLLGGDGATAPALVRLQRGKELAQIRADGLGHFAALP